MYRIPRVLPGRRARGAYVPTSTNNCTGKTTAAGPLPGWHRDCELNRRRQTPSRLSTHLMRTRMTVPAVHASREHHHAQGALDFQQTPTADPTGLLLRAIALDLHPAAFKAYTAAVLTLPGGEAWSVAQVADAARVTHHAARFAVAQLVDAGLLVARRMVVRDEDGTPRDAKRYFLVGGGR